MEKLPCFDDDYSCKTRNLLELFEGTYEKQKETIENPKKEFLDNINRIEKDYKINRNYLKLYQKSELNYNMRAILVDWMFEVADEYKLKRDTIYEAVHILDRVFMTRCPIVQKENLQGLAITALHIAAKKEVNLEFFKKHFIFLKFFLFFCKKIKIFLFLGNLSTEIKGVCGSWSKSI